MLNLQHSLLWGQHFPFWEERPHQWGTAKTPSDVLIKHIKGNFSCNFKHLINLTKILIQFFCYALMRLSSMHSLQEIINNQCNWRPLPHNKTSHQYTFYLFIGWWLFIVVTNSHHTTWNLCFTTSPRINLPWPLHALFRRTVLFAWHLDVDVALPSILLGSRGQGSHENGTQVDRFVRAGMMEPQVDPSRSGRRGKMGHRFIFTNLDGCFWSWRYVHTDIDIV